MRFWCFVIGVNQVTWCATWLGFPQSRSKKYRWPCDSFGRQIVGSRSRPTWYGTLYMALLKCSLSLYNQHLLVCFVWYVTADNVAKSVAAMLWFAVATALSGAAFQLLLLMTSTSVISLRHVLRHQQLIGLVAGCCHATAGINYLNYHSRLA